MHSDWQRLLVILTAGAGDVVDALPAVRALKTARPEIKIGVIIRPSSSSLIEACRPGLIDQVFVYMRSNGTREMFNLWRTVRRFGPEAALCPAPLFDIRLGLLAFALLASVGALLLARPILTLTYGVAYQPATLTLQILTLTLVPATQNSLLIIYLCARGDEKVVNV